MEEKVNRRNGISLLDVVILILIVGVIAALVIPNTRMKKAEEAKIRCQEQQMAINEAMVRYFTTAGDTMLLKVKVETAEVDSSDSTGSEEEVATEEAEGDTMPPIRMFTEDTTLLRPYLPAEYSFTCPLDGDAYIIIARDSSFYSISCPNDGHGQIIKGRPTWEE